MLLGGCKVFETEAPAPLADVPRAFDNVPGRDIAVGPQNLSRWWVQWRDATLTRLIDEAIAYNSDVRVARAHVDEARAFAAIAESALYPTVGAAAGQVGGAAQWRNPVVDLVPVGTHSVDAHLAGATASWEPDIWGGRADDAAAAHAAALSVEEQLNGAHMVVAADVAENYVELLGVERRLAILDESIAAIIRLQRYVEARFHAGQAQAYDITLVREKLETQRAERPSLASLVDVRRRRLAVLRGRPPEGAGRLGGGQWSPPRAPRGQTPVEVLERRPDVRAKALIVEAQVAKLSSAKTDLLPRFQINFFGGDGRLHFEGVPGLQGTGGLASLIVQLPIFTAGRIEANIAANDAKLRAAAAAYDGAVLRALEDVENAYGQRLASDRRVAELVQALASTRRNETIAQGLYEGGRKTLDDVLNAKLAVFERGDELVQAQMKQASDTINLYKALGGGW